MCDLGVQGQDCLLVRVLVPTNGQLHVYEREGKDEEVRWLRNYSMEPFQYYNVQLGGYLS